MSGKVLVIGSMNMDLVVETVRYPEAGETIIGGKFEQIPGGKGANQALAAGKLGIDVEFIGACGNDTFANKLKDSLKSGGVKINNIFNIEGVNTGIAVITVEENGDNRIIVSPGANYYLNSNKINHIETKIAESDLVLLQLEIPLDSIEKIIEFAGKHQTKVILDPAPATKLSEEVLKKIDFLLPNEGELKLMLADYNLKNREEEIAKLLKIGVKNIIVTEGEEGVSFYNKDQNLKISALAVNVVDTTAAGDVFAGAFAASIIKSNDIKESLEFAVQAATYSVTKFGAQNSMPDLKELEEFLKERS